MIAASQIYLGRGGGAKVPTAADYMQNGLVAMWDGIENAGWGVHDASATTWTDLITGRQSSSIGNRTWGDSFLVTTGNFNLNTLVDGSIRTLEAVFSTESSDVQCVVIALNSRKTIGVTGTSVGIGPYQAIPVTNPTNRIITVSATYPADSNTADAGYVDGEINENRTSVDFTNPFSSGVYVGGPYSKPFSGNVYSIRAYSRELIAAEIAANYAVDKARFNLP